jgi:cardiolipin synthase
LLLAVSVLAHSLLTHRATRLLILLATCTSCASPQVRSADGAPPAPIVTAQGSLSPATAAQTVDARLAPRYDSEEVRQMVHAFRQQAGTPLVAGNRVALLVDGPQTLGAIRRAIEGAQHHVHIETYIFADDEIGREFRDLLIRRRQQGLEVRVIYDAIGSVDTSADFFKSMTDAGVEVHEFRPLDPARTPLPWKVNNRDHRKLVIVDGRTAFTGGINISSTYASSSSAKPGPEAGREQAWRDTHVEIEGPVVAQFQGLFLETWTRAGGKVDAKSPQYFPQMVASGPELVAAVATSGDDRNEATIYATYHATVARASRRLWLTQAYFAPNGELRKSLIDAAHRGVDVRIIVPGFTDSALIFHASRSSYEELLEGGVRIFEQRDALLHAKTLVVDTALSTVGSANFDMRSFLHNNEVNAVVVGSDFARRMEQLFERDQANAHELQLDSWRKRPYADKFKEFASALFSYWL